jgi:hypothetical protein
MDAIVEVNLAFDVLLRPPRIRDWPKPEPRRPGECSGLDSQLRRKIGGRKTGELNQFLEQFVHLCCRDGKWTRIAKRGHPGKRALCVEASDEAVKKQESGHKQKRRGKREFLCASQEHSFDLETAAGFVARNF